MMLAELSTPASITLGTGVVALAVVLAWSQIKGTLDLADGFKDETGKTSASRICAVGSWLASTWYLMSHSVSDTVFLGYCGLWAALLLGSKGLDMIRDIVSIWKGNPVTVKHD